jgi:dephospho-CoA kinase
MKIGLIGAPNSGKDVIADFLVKNKGFRKFAFADRIKKEYYATSGYSEEQFKNSRGTELEQIIRIGLWKFSDEKRNEFGNLHFITPVIQEIIDCQTSVVVSDVRTLYEFDQLNKIGSIMIHVYRTVFDLTNEYIPGTRLRTLTTKALLKFYNNYSTLELFQEKLVEFFKEIGI